MFWKTYRKHIKKEISRMRQNDICQFKTSFVRSEFSFYEFHYIFFYTNCYIRAYFVIILDYLKFYNIDNKTSISNKSNKFNNTSKHNSLLTNDVLN